MNINGRHNDSTAHSMQKKEEKVTKNRIYFSLNKKPKFSQIGLFFQHLELLPPVKS